jgi:hypothetical protein
MKKHDKKAIEELHKHRGIASIVMCSGVAALVIGAGSLWGISGFMMGCGFIAFFIGWDLCTETLRQEAQLRDDISAGE